MPNIRRLAYKDRYVWELVQQMTGGSSSLPPVVFQPGTPVTFALQWTEEQFTEVLSALMTGADLSYPEKSHEVVWNLLQQIEYPLPLPPPAGNDSRMMLFARFAQTPSFTQLWNGNVNQPFGGYVSQVAPAASQLYGWDVYLTPGTWQIDVLYVREINSANAQIWFVNDVAGTSQLIGTMNFSGSFLLNQIQSFNWTQTDSALGAIRIIANGLISPSTGYRMNLTACQLWRD